MNHLSSSTWNTLYPQSYVYKELFKEAQYWLSLREESPNAGQGRLLPHKVYIIVCGVCILIIVLFQFSELASCCHDIVNNLCSDNKLQSLIQTSGNHVLVWERNIITAIHQLRDRFPTFHDLIQPFMASLSVVCIFTLTDST